MKIVLLLALAMAAVAASVALEGRKVDQHEENELQDLNVEDNRDKRHLLKSRLLHSSRVSVNEHGTKLRIKEMTHNTVDHRCGGLRRGLQLHGLGSGLSHKENRRVFSAGIAGPLGAVGIHRESYNQDLRLTREKQNYTSPCKVPFSSTLCRRRKAENK